MSTKKHYAYLLECADNSIYAGYTTDVVRREKEHNEGIGSRYTRGRQPSNIVYCEVFDSRSEATSREAHFKKLTKSQKLELIKNHT